MKYAIGFLFGVIASSIFFTIKLKKVTENSGDEVVQNEEVATNETEGLPADFEEFYLKFHKDSLYQIEHVLFPLRGMPFNADSLTKASEYHWLEEDWKMHRPFHSNNGEFSRDFLSLNNLVTEDIYTKDGFGMQRRFMKNGDNWYLIYYSAMNKIGE